MSGSDQAHHIRPREAPSLPHPHPHPLLFRPFSFSDDMYRTSLEHIHPHMYVSQDVAANAIFRGPNHRGGVQCFSSTKREWRLVRLSRRRQKHFTPEQTPSILPRHPWACRLPRSQAGRPRTLGSPPPPARGSSCGSGRPRRRTRGSGVSAARRRGLCKQKRGVAKQMRGRLL